VGDRLPVAKSFWCEERGNVEEFSCQEPFCCDELWGSPRSPELFRGRLIESLPILDASFQFCPAPPPNAGFLPAGSLDGMLLGENWLLVIKVLGPGLTMSSWLLLLLSSATSTANVVAGLPSTLTE